ncbi:MAG: RIP metalloprotease RseP [Parvibaculales bacterium]
METLLTIFVGYLLPFLAIITVVVFFHELGHFWVARKCGVKVEAFAIGFGRALTSWTDRHGTVWKICWLPLGGYVKFYGDDSVASNPDADKLAQIPESDREGIFHFKPLWQRTAVVAAGPFANFILAIFIFAGMYTILGERVVTPVVETVFEQSAAERAGIISGDVILAVDGEDIISFSEVRRIVSVNPETDLVFTVERGGVLKNLVARPDLIEEKDRFGNVYRVGRLGFTNTNDPAYVKHIRHNPLVALVKGVEETAFIIEQTFVSLGRIISGRESADALGGPIRIAQISGQMASIGMIALINLAAVLSVSIGLINLFPIPMLDGGHLLFYGFEAALGKPLPENIQEIGMRIGLALVLMLFVFVTWNDLTQPNLFN